MDHGSASVRRIDHSGRPEQHRLWLSRVESCLRKSAILACRLATTGMPGNHRRSVSCHARPRPSAPPSFRRNRMKTILVALVGLCVTPVLAFAAPAKHFPSGGSAASGPTPAYSAAVELGDTLYVSGTADGTDPATGKRPVDATTGAKVVLNSVKKILETAGYTMDDLVWVQIFATDLKD